MFGPRKLRLPYTITAVRQDEKMQSVRHSALIAAAKARIWESEGWHVVISDPDGRACEAGQFDQRAAPAKSEPMPHETEAAGSPDEPGSATLTQATPLPEVVIDGGSAGATDDQDEALPATA